MNIRDELPLAFDNAKACDQLFQKVILETDADAIFRGYIGAVHLAKARHASIFKKMSYFNKGTKILDNAVADAPEEVELHFLRMTIQLNAPGFLGYSKELEEDKAFVFEHFFEAEDDIQRRMREYITESGYFSEEEVAAIQV
jgi:hypothetical protein